MSRPVFIDSSYYQRAWRALTGERGWVGRVLLMFCALVVPVAGVLGVMGYCLERARTVAWGMSEPPERGSLGVGRCLRSGLRGFAVAFVWAFVPALAVGVATALLGAVGLGGLTVALALPEWAVMVCAGAMGSVAALRATIYQRISCGFDVSAVFRMCRHGVSGLGRIVLSQMVVGLGWSFLLTMVVMCVGMPLATAVLALNPALVDEANRLMGPNSLSYEDALRLLWVAFLVLLPVIIVTVLANLAFSALVYPVHYIALGLWMVQFDVAAWGGPSDPMPEPIPAERPWTYGAWAAAGGTAPSGHADPPPALPQMTTDMPLSGYTAPVTSAAAAPGARFCPRCGSPLVAGDRFCRGCGATVPHAPAPAEGGPGDVSGPPVGEGDPS